MLFAVIKKKGIIITVLAITLVVVTMFMVSLTGAQAVFFGKSPKKLPIYYVRTVEKKVAISFDCAWGTDYTDNLLSVMEKENVKCTFFAVEFWVNKHPDYVKKIFNAGHEIGTHSATHPYMSKLSSDAIERELNTSCKAIENITGVRPTLFRAPYGDYNDRLIDVATNKNLYVIQWDVDSLDWKDLSAKQITERVLKRVKNGSIVLFHNQGLHTAEALPTIIKGLKERGYTFYPIGEMIYKDNYVINSDGGQTQNL